MTIYTVCFTPPQGTPSPSASLCSNTNGSPSANNTLTMITETKPIERKGWPGRPRSSRSHSGEPKAKERPRTSRGRLLPDVLAGSDALLLFPTPSQNAETEETGAE